MEEKNGEQFVTVINMFESIFKDHNEDIRKKYIEEYGVDINQLTPKDKANFMKSPRSVITSIDLITNNPQALCKKIKIKGTLTTNKK